MSAKSPPTKAEFMPKLANGINHVLATSFGGEIEFVLIVALPSDEEGYVELSTITGITDPDRLKAIAHHIGDLAKMHKAKELDRDSDEDVLGHA